MRSYRRTLILLISLLANGGGGLFYCRPVRLAAQNFQSIRVVSQPSEATALLEVALRLGYFADAGLRVTFVSAESNESPLEGLNSGKGEMAAVSDRAIIEAAFRRSSFRILSSVYGNHSTIKVLTRGDRGIVAPKNLVGKKVGAVRGLAGQALRSSFFWQFGIAPGEVEVVELTSDKLLEAFSSGEIDALSTRDPFIAGAKRRFGERTRLFSETDASSNALSLAVTARFLQENRSAVKSFVRALLRAEEFVRQEPAAAKVLLARELGFERNYLDGIWDDCQFTVQLDQGRIAALEEKSRWLVQNGKIAYREIPDFIHLFDVQLLREMKPSAVGMFP